LHFFSDQFRGTPDWSGSQALRHVGPSILMGHLAAVLGYGSLLIAPLPGVRQMALFSVVGLAVACACVLCLFPVLARRSRVHDPIALRMARKVADSPVRFRLNTRHVAVALALAVFAVMGMARLDTQDDVRLLQASPPALVAEERDVARILDTRLSRTFFMVRGADAEQVLQREERLREALRPLREAGTIGSIVAISRALPSLKRQHADRALLSRTIHGSDGLAPRLLRELGADASTVEAAVRPPPETAPLLTPAAWWSLRGTQALRGLWLEDVGGGPASVVLLSDVDDTASVADAAAGLEGVTHVDRVQEISSILRSYREVAVWWMLAVYAMILGWLSVRYGLRGGMKTLLPPVAATALVLGLLGWIGVPVSLFNVLALLLVLGMGVDYAVFLREGRREQPTVLVAIGLSALTTLFSFGLLAFSATPFIRAIGLTLTPGIALIFLLAVWLGPDQRREETA
ncbi:MAG: MMPL family transporter, partial [Panacagrimonas sp.]